MMCSTSQRLAACGVAAAAFAAARADEPVFPVKVIAHLYVNVATGEVTRTPAAGPRFGEAIWTNDDTEGSCFKFYGLDRPGGDPVPVHPSMVNWGDLSAMSRVEGFEFGFATQPDPITCGVPAGMRVRLGFIERYDSLVNPGGPITAPDGPGPAREVAAFSIGGFGGEYECGLSAVGVIVTVDLEGSGLEFVLGDTASGLGEDLDLDGLADFGYSYTMQQDPQDFRVICGPLLVRPASLGGQGTATGVPDLFSWFSNLMQPYDGYSGDYNFGGGDCPVPFAVAYLTLYGPRPGSYCGDIDYTADGLIDFTDYLEFLNRFDAGDASADLNGDGRTDFADWLEFYNRYDACRG